MFELPLKSSRSTNYRAAIKTLIANEGKKGSQNQIDILKLASNLEDKFIHKKTSWLFVRSNYSQLSIIDLHLSKKKADQKTGLRKVILTPFE